MVIISLVKVSKLAVIRSNHCTEEVQYFIFVILNIFYFLNVSIEVIKYHYAIFLLFYFILFYVFPTLYFDHVFFIVPRISTQSFKDNFRFLLSKKMEKHKITKIKIKGNKQNTYKIKKKLN